MQVDHSRRCPRNPGMPSLGKKSARGLLSVIPKRPRPFRVKGAHYLGLRPPFLPQAETWPAFWDRLETQELKCKEISAGLRKR